MIPDLRRFLQQLVEHRKRSLSTDTRQAVGSFSFHGFILIAASANPHSFRIFGYLRLLGILGDGIDRHLLRLAIDARGDCFSLRGGGCAGGYCDADAKNEC